MIAETSNILVKNNITDNAIYAVRSATIDSSVEGNFTTVSSGIGGAFNILDVLADGITFLSGLPGKTPPGLTAFWETNSCNGTFFERANNSIHLLGGCPSDNSADTDEYDDIILHEFGHFASFNFSKDDSSGGRHFLDDNTEDIRLAWSEGWAHFFSSAIRGNPTQVDTVGSIASFFEIEGPSLPFSSIYTTSEVSVAAVLWDIFDDSGINEAFDLLSPGIPPIWDVFKDYLPTVEFVSIEDFWDGWFIQLHNNEAEMLNIIKDRKMELFEDKFEPDNTIALAKPITVDDPLPQQHTLYPAGDIDVVAFSVTKDVSYTIETLNLSNGADTFLEVLDSGTIPIASNDDRTPLDKSCPPCPPNNATALSSRVSIIAPATGTLFARVSRSLSAPDSAGVYGSYDLRITSP